MIITKTPYRVSFQGGGTDFPSWYEQHGSAILSCTVNKYCYVALRYMPPFLGKKYLLYYQKSEAVDTIEEIQHPSVRGCLQLMGIDRGIEINHAGDLPARSGLGSSSAFTVGLLHALHALKGEYVNKSTLAREAIEVEQVILREAVGIQDQIGAAQGGLNVISVHQSGEWAIHPVTLPAERQKALESRLMLFYTGLQRYSSDIQQGQVAAIGQNRSKLHAVRRLVEDATAALAKGDLDEFGMLLDEGWTLKRGLTDKISNSAIDEAYAAAKAAGALGGKLLGAGGGGFMLIYANPQHQDAVRSALSSMIEVPFAFEHGGSQIVLADR